MQSSGINPFRGTAGELSKQLTNQINKIACWVFFSVMEIATVTNQVLIFGLILPHCFRGHWENYSKVSKMNNKYQENSTASILPVQSHQYKSVDGDKSCSHDEELVKFAPNISKWPRRGEGIICSCERNTEYDEKDVSNLDGDTHWFKDCDKGAVAFFTIASCWSKCTVSVHVALCC